MDLIDHNPTIHYLLIQYGSFALFLLLAMGIIALPVPEETLMVLTGILIQLGHVKVPQIILAAYFGSLCGITVSYLLGRSAGHALLNKAVNWMGGDYTHYLEKSKSWFARFGKWALFIGYFIPGFRHFMGVFAGMSTLQFSEFALFAYTGAFFWVSFYLSMGYFFGHYGFALYEKFFNHIETSVEYIVIVALIILVIYFIYKKQTQIEKK